MKQRCSKCRKPLEKERVKAVARAVCQRCQHENQLKLARINNEKRKLKANQH